MKNLITYFSKFAPDNGSGMHRLWTENGPMKSRKLFAVLALLLFVGVGQMWGNTATFTISGKSGSSSPYTITGTLSGAPTGATASCRSTYNNANQLTSGNSQTLTLSGFDGCTISGVTVHVKCNKSSGAGSGTLTINGSSAGSLASQSGLGSTYTNKSFTVTSTVVGTGNTVVITLTASASSFYCDSYTVTYTPKPARTVSFSTGTGNPSVLARTEASGGAGITLPTRSDLTPACSSDGWYLYGWATAAYGSSSTTTAPSATLVGYPGMKYYPSSDITIYAVYAKATGAATAQTLTGSYSSHTGWTISGVATPSTYWVLCTDGTITSPTLPYLGDVTSITFSARTYGGSSYKTIVVETDGGTSVGSTNANSGTMTSGYSISVSGLTTGGAFVFSSTTTTANNGPGINDITINYTAAPSIYWSAPTCSSCDAPTSPIKGSFSAGNQNVSWTAPGSAPTNGYLVAYSTATSTAPDDNVYTTSGNYTVVAVAAGTTNVNIPCTTTGTYNWWVRSKCSADNSSLSSWVPATGQSFTMTTVYLKNTVNWANAYVSFYSSSYWDASDGTGSSRASGSYVADPAAMTYTESTGLFSYICPSGYTYASFAKDKQDNYGNFYETEAIYCDNDFQFNKVVVPTTQSGTATHHSTKYYKTYTYETFDAGKGTGYYCAGDFNSFETLGNEFSVVGGVLTYTKSLSANTRYGFKIYHHGEYWRNDGGAFVHSIEDWSMVNTEGYNTYFISGPAGTYTFTYDQNDHEVSVTYPDCAHPCANYAYFENTNSWSNVYAHIYDNSTSTPINAWHGVPLSLTQTICGHTYYYGAIECSNYDKVIYNDGGSNQIDAKNTSSCSGKHSDASTTAWTPFTTYTISYAAGDGGSGEMASHSGLCPGDNQALSPNIFTKDHYHFTSWKTNVAVTINTGGGDQNIDANGIVPGGATIKSIGSNVTLTAQWEINSNTLTWDWDGGSTSSTTYTLYPATSGSVNYNAAITKPANGTMSKTGYNFNGWSSNATNMPDEALTITAQWTAKTYNNTLDREGGTTGSTSVTTTYNSSTLTGYTAPTKTGYTFGGYWSGDDGTGTEVIGTNGALKASVTVSAVAWTNSSSQWVKDGAVTMYAKWTAKNYTVTLNDGSGSGGSGSKSVTYNANTNLTTNVAVPTYAGNDFRGYYTSTGGGGTKVIDGNGAWIKGTSYVDASGNWVYDGSPTLHAYYTTYAYENYRTNCSDMYDIVLDDGLVATTNNGSAKVADNGTTLTSIVAPTKNGYDIEGYYTTSGLATKIATDAGALSKDVTVSGDDWTNGSNQWVLGAGATFYTKWSARTYTITYEGLEGASNTNPTSYNIETTTFALANPGSRTGYTFSNWTSGGTPITQITVGSTGDKTITANWTLNQHTVAVSAADHVVISATPADESAIAEGANRNVNYNKTVTLGCTPDAHWNITWDVYKTGESSTKVVVTGSGNGATFTMPDYAVTVTAVMTEDTYHTATFKNNGEVIDGYDEVKTYDGTRPSAPTLTDVTDACDKTDCNKFYGWIAESDIWSKTINSVAGKTIYRRAADIPNVSGADVVYHAVWAKGTATPEISSTLIAKWDKQSLTASTAIKAKDPSGSDINTITLTPNFSTNQTSGIYCCNSSGVSVYPTITISGLDFSEYDYGGICFYTRTSTNAVLTIKTSSGGDYANLTTFTTAGKEHPCSITNIPKNTTSIQIVSANNSGSFYFGFTRIYGVKSTPTYNFTELTAENTSGWTGADWDGYYLITFNSSAKAVRSDGIEGWYGLTNVTPSEGVITTSDIGLIFKATYSAGNSGYAVQGLASQCYINTAKRSEAYHLLNESAAYISSIAYNQLLLSDGKAFRWNSDRSGEYAPAYGVAPTLYKIMSTFTEFRITCCDNEITIGSPTKTGSGNVTFASGGDDYAVGDKVETCEGATVITATVTPSNGYQCTALTFSRADGEDVVIDVDPATAVPFRAATDFEITVEQNANTTLNTTVTFVALHDYYIDKMHYNSTIDKSGNYNTVPSLSSETKGTQCTGSHYKFKGWVAEDEINTDGSLKSGYTLISGGATGKYATGTNYYSVWAEEN